MEMVFQQEGIPWGVSGWPKQLVEQLKRMSREREYRGIYATLSSQVHNDADALIDYIIVKTLGKDVDNAVEMSSGEMLGWLRLFIYGCCDVYADAALSYARHYGLRDSIELIMTHKEELKTRLQKYTRH